MDGIAPLRVLFLNENLGGHATVHLGIRAGLADRPDIAATFVDVPAPRALGRVLGAQLPGLAHHDLDLQPIRAQLARSMAARRLLTGVAAAHDVVHVYTQHAALLSSRILRARAAVVTTDATGEQVARMLPHRRPTRFTGAQDRLRHPLEDRVYRAATRVVAKSEWAARSLRDAYGLRDDQLRLVPLGIPLPPVAHRTAHDGPRRVTFVGFTMERKGGMRLLRAYRESLRGACELHLVTRDRVDAEPGVHVHRDLSPGDARLPELLRATDVFAFPTEIDTFGNAALEAMAMGVPVVATRCGALPEIVDDGVTGLLVAADDRADGDRELVAAIRALLDDPTRAHAMGEAGRRRALERFDARATTARLLEVIVEARDAHRAVSPDRYIRHR